jgi:hypothetical protein
MYSFFLFFKKKSPLLRFRTSIVIAKETNIYIYIYILVSLAITMLVRNGEEMNIMADAINAQSLPLTCLLE